MTRAMKRILIACAVLFAALFASALPARAAGTTSMYRLYNPNSGEHFYTGNAKEKNYLASIGWKYEGVGWKAPAKSNTPVYRLYNPNAGDHHYTMDPDEKNMLVRVGWNYEGIGWYSDEMKAVPLYRQYNPNARAGSHNYTTNKAENDHLVAIGWRGEGIAWYGVDTDATRSRNWSSYMKTPTEKQIKAVRNAGRSPYIAIYPNYPGVSRMSEICVDFHTDHQPFGTYMCPMNWWMDVSPLEARYARVYNDYTGTPGGYLGFQCLDDGSKVFIMTVWTIFCEDNYGNVTRITPRVTYPRGGGNEANASSEGSFVQCIQPFDWKAGRDYRVLLQRGVSADTGNAVLLAWVNDLTVNSWQKLVEFDTGAKDIYMYACGAFLENFLIEYTGEVRSMELSNLKARNAETGQWVAADYATFLYNGSLSAMDYTGSGSFGTDGSSIWAITSGVSGLCNTPSDSKKYYLKAGDLTNPY